MNTGIDIADTSSNGGTVNGLSGFNFGVIGDFIQDATNDFAASIGKLDVVGSFMDVIRSLLNEPTALTTTIHILNGGGANNVGIVGQKLTLKPKTVGETIVLKDNPSANASTAGNLLLGADITITDIQEITLRFQDDVTYSDGVGGWIVHSNGGAGAGGGGSTLPVIDTTSIVKGSVDATKLLRFEVDGFTTATTRVMTPPNQDTTLAGLTVTSQTWTGTNIFTGAVSINDTNFFIRDGADITKQLNFELLGSTTGKVLSLATSNTDNRTLTYPDATANFFVTPAFEDLNMNSKDVINVDRLEIQGGTTSATSVNDYVWYIDSSSNLISNVNAAKNWIWTSANVSKMILSDSTLQKLNVTAPSFELYNTRAAATGTAGTINILANSTSIPTGATMGFIIGNTESISGNGTGSLDFGVNVAGVLTSFLTMNDNNDGDVRVNKDFVPTTDNSFQLGLSSLRWSEVVCAGTVFGSDFEFDTASGTPPTITASSDSTIMNFNVDGLGAMKLTQDGANDSILELIGDANPRIKTRSTDAVPIDQVIGGISFDGFDSDVSTVFTYADIEIHSRNVGAASKEGEIEFNVMKANVSTNIVKIIGTGFHPVTDNVSQLGTSSLRWSEIVCAGTVFASDFEFDTASGTPPTITASSDSTIMNFNVDGLGAMKLTQDGANDSILELIGDANPRIKTRSTDAVPIDQVIGGISFDGFDSDVSTVFTYADIEIYSRNVGASSKEGEIEFNVMKANVSTNMLKIDGVGLTMLVGGINLGGGDISNTNSIISTTGTFNTVTTISSGSTAGYRDTGTTANPTTPLEGEMYYNNSSNEYRFFDGSVWVSMAGGGGGGANTALSNLASTTVNASLNLNSGIGIFSLVAGTSNIGSATFPFGKFSIKDIEIETGGTMTTTKNNIVSDTGGTRYNVPTGDTHTFLINGNASVLIDVDEIQFALSGRQHKITASANALQLVSENESDAVEIITGGSRTNPTIEVNDTTTTWLTETDDTQAVLLQFIQNNNTPADFRTIANLDFMAENSSSSNEIYARISSSSQDITNATEDGLLQLGVMSAGTLISAMDMEGGTSATDGALISFYGQSTVARQTLSASPTTTQISTVLRNLGLTKL